MKILFIVKRREMYNNFDGKNIMLPIVSGFTIWETFFVFNIITFFEWVAALHFFLTTVNSFVNLVKLPCGVYIGDLSYATSCTVVTVPWLFPLGIWLLIVVK